MAQGEAAGSVVYVGVDVCKQWLDVSSGAPGGAQRLPRTAEAWTAWLQQRRGQKLHLVVEATGGYEDMVSEQCDRSSVAHSIVNPLRVRQFAKAVGRLAKTDRIDADVLEEFGRATRPRAHVRLSPERARLRAFVERRRDLVLARAAEKNRIKQASEDTRDDVQEHIDWLDEAISRMDQRIAQALRQVDAHHEQAKRLNFPPPSGQVDYAAIAASWLLSSNPMGHS